jgi:hypothetical protein
MEYRSVMIAFAFLGCITTSILASELPAEFKITIQGEKSYPKRLPTINHISMEGPLLSRLPASVHTYSPPYTIDYKFTEAEDIKELNNLEGTMITPWDLEKKGKSIQTLSQEMQNSINTVYKESQKLMAGKAGSFNYSPEWLNATQVEKEPWRTFYSNFLLALGKNEKDEFAEIRTLVQNEQKKTLKDIKEESRGWFFHNIWQRIVKFRQDYLAPMARYDWWTKERIALGAGAAGTAALGTYLYYKQRQ